MSTGSAEQNTHDIVPEDPAPAFQTRSLFFDARFESGSILGIVRTDETQYELKLRMDSNSKNKRAWLHFRCSQIPKLGLTVIFTVNGLLTSWKQFLRGMTPLVRSTSRPNWKRLPSSTVFVNPGNPGQISWVFRFDRQESYYFCLLYPYTYTMLSRYAQRLASVPILRSMVTTVDITAPYVALLSRVYHETGRLSHEHALDTVLGASVKNRRSLSALRITNKTVSDAKKRAIVITARVHPGETPSSYVCHGMIEFLLSNHPLAQALRSHFVFYFVPCLNPTGCALGNYRCCEHGNDLNRQWEAAAQGTQTCPAVSLVSTLALIRAIHGCWSSAYLDTSTRESLRTATQAFCPNSVTEERLDVWAIGRDGWSTLPAQAESEWFEGHDVLPCGGRANIGPTADFSPDYLALPSSLSPTRESHPAQYSMNCLLRFLIMRHVPGLHCNSAQRCAPFIDRRTDQRYSSLFQTVPRLVASVREVQRTTVPELPEKDIPLEIHQQVAQRVLEAASAFPFDYLRSLFGSEVTDWTPLDLVIDCHSHSRIQGAFFFINPDIRPELVSCLPPNSFSCDCHPAAPGVPLSLASTAIEAIFPILAHRRSIMLQCVGQSIWKNSDSENKNTTLRRVLRRCLVPSPLTYTFEISNFHAKLPLLPSDMCRVGMCAMLGLADMYDISSDDVRI